MSMLHIHNGDSSADNARQSSLAGEHFAWQESLITGPTPTGLAADEWQQVRARHLSESYGVNEQECAQRLASQEEKLASFGKHEEVVLWFEHDLFCQLHLLYLLDWFSRHDLGHAKLSLICIGEFPGKESFRGLGELTGAELASLFPARREVTPQVMNLAVSAWRACRSPNPTEIENVLRDDTSELPFLRAALAAHLARFPATRNGLGRIENVALELISGGLNSFPHLFQRFSEAEPVYGLGDAQLWLALQRLSEATQPLLAIAGDQSQPASLALTPNARVELTRLGASTLKDDTDFVAVNGIDLWLGGVRLHDKDNLWRWNEQTLKLELVAAKRSRP